MTRSDALGGSGKDDRLVVAESDGSHDSEGSRSVPK